MKDENTPDAITVIEMHAILAQKFSQLLSQAIRVGGAALPEDQCLPAQAFECRKRSTVSGDISFKLRIPELHSGFRRRGFAAAAVPMPEAAVNKHHFFPGRKHEIRRSRQILPMKTVSVTHSVEGSSDDQFGSCVSTSDFGH